MKIFRLMLLVVFVAMAGAAGAAGSWTFGGFGVSTSIYSTDTAVEHYALYAITEEMTSASELAKRYESISIGDFKSEAAANAVNSSGSIVEQGDGFVVSLNGIFADGKSRETYLDDYGISDGLYAVVVYNDTMFKVMDHTFKIPGVGHLVYTDGEWASFAAPEPTSALLLLLGVAGLALRRR